MSDLKDGYGGPDDFTPLAPEFTPLAPDDTLLLGALSGDDEPSEFGPTYAEDEPIDLLAEGVDSSVVPIVEDRYAPVPEETGADLMDMITGVQGVHQRATRIAAGADHGNVRSEEELDLMAERSAENLSFYPLAKDTYLAPTSRGLRSRGLRQHHAISGGPMMPHWQQMKSQAAISVQIQEDFDKEWDKGNYISAITGYFGNLQQAPKDIPTLDDIVESGEFFVPRGPQRGERKGLSRKVEESTKIGVGIGAGIGAVFGTIKGFSAGGAKGAVTGGLGGMMLGGMMGGGATYFTAASLEEDTVSPFLLRMYSLTEIDFLRRKQVDVAGMVGAAMLDGLAVELANHGIDIQPKLDELNVVATQQLQKIEQDQREGKIRHHVLVDRLGQLMGQSFLEIMQFAIEKPEFRAKLLRDRERVSRRQKPDDLTWTMLNALHKSQEDFGSTAKEQEDKKAYLQAQFQRIMHMASYEGLPEELRRDRIDLEGFKSLISGSFDLDGLESNAMFRASPFFSEAARSVLNDEPDEVIQENLDKVSFGVLASSGLWHLLKSDDHNVFPDDAKVRNWAQEHQTATRIWGSGATINMERSLGRMMMTPTKIGDQVYMPESTFAMLMRMTMWAPSAVAEIDFAEGSSMTRGESGGWEVTNERVVNWLTPASYDRAHNVGLRDFKAGYFARLAAAIRTGNIGMQPAIADIMRAEGMRPGGEGWQVWQYVGLALDFLVPWERPYLLAAGKIAGATAATPRVLRNTKNMPRGHRASMLYAQVAPGLYSRAKGLQDADVLTAVHNVILEAQKDLHAKGDNTRPYIDKISQEQVDEMLRIAGVEPDKVHALNTNLLEEIRQARVVGMQQGLGVIGTPGVAASRQSPGFQRFRQALTEAMDQGIIPRDQYAHIVAQFERQAAVIANDPTIPQIQTISDFFEAFELTLGRQPGPGARFMEGPAEPGHAHMAPKTEAARRLVEADGGRMVDPANVVSSQKVLDEVLMQSEGGVNVRALNEKIKGEGQYYEQTSVQVDSIKVSADDMYGVDPKRADSSKGPIVIGRDGSIIDGRHRYALALQRGDDVIDVYRPIDAPTPRAVEGARIPWSTRKGTPAQRAEAFDALPDDAVVTLFHATSDANAENLIAGGNAAPQRQGRGIEGLDDGIYVGTDPISIEGMGPRILAVTVKKSQVSPSSEYLRTSPNGTVGGALVQGAATGGVVSGKPIRVEDVTGAGRYAFADDVALTPRAPEAPATAAKTVDDRPIESVFDDFGEPDPSLDNAARKLAKDADMGITRDRELDSVIRNEDGEVIAAQWRSFDNENYEFDVVVAPKYRGTGLGSRLIDDGISGFDEMLDVNPDSTMRLTVTSDISEASLSRRGFKVVEDDGRLKIMERTSTPRAPEAPAGREIPPQMRAETAGARTPDEIAEAGRLWREQGTESPYFQRWSGGAPVVIGRPSLDRMPVGPVLFRGFHGTGQRFDVFEYSKIGTRTDRGISPKNKGGFLGEGFYFNTMKKAAELYAGDDGIVMPVIVKLENPIHIVGGYRPHRIREALGLPKEASATEVSDVLRSKGYDGVTYRRHRMGEPGYEPGRGEGVEVMALNQHNLKSAYNRGTFDPADPRIRYMRGPGRVPMGFFEWSPQTNRHIINLYHNANMGVLWHENGHLLATIMGRRWSSKLFKFFDHTVDGVGSVKLTSRGHEQLAEAWRMYRKIRDSRHGPVRRLFDQLWLEVRNLYYSLRGQPGALPRQAIRIWDLEFGPDPRIVAYSIEAAKQVTKKSRPRLVIDADKAKQIREEYPRKHGGSRERRRGRLDEDTVRQQLGLKFETFVDTMPDGTRIPRRRLMKQDVDALDIYEKAVAIVLLEKIRTDLGPQKIFRPTRRTMLPEDRANRVFQSIRDRWIQVLGQNPAKLANRVVQRKYHREVGFTWREMSELGDNVTQADVNALADRMRIQTGNTFKPDSVHNLELIVFNDREAAGFHTLVHEMAAEPMGNRIPDGMLDPDTSFRLVERGEVERVREVMIDVEAGVGARASRRIESIPDTLVTQMMNGFSAAAEKGATWVPFFREHTAKIKKFFEIPTFGKDYFDDGVRDILETANRRVGTIDQWVLSTQRRLKAEDTSLAAAVDHGFNQNGFVALVTDLRRQLTPIIDVGQVRMLDDIHRELNSIIDTMDVVAHGKLLRGETLAGLEPDVAGVSVQTIYRKIDGIQAILGDWYGMTPNERTAVITVREYKLRPPNSLTEIELYKLADSIKTIKMGIDVKHRAVGEKARKLWRMMGGDSDKARASKLTDAEVLDIYVMFYNGDFEGLWAKATRVGLKGYDVNKLSTFDPNKAFLEMVVRMRAEEIMEQLGRDLAEYGLNGELRSLSNFKNIGDDPTFDREHFGLRVEHHIGEMINWRNKDVMEAEGMWEFRESQGRSPRPTYTGKYHAAQKVPKDKWGTVESATKQITDPYDFMAMTVATDMLYKWGFKFGKGEWEFVELADGTKQLMPQMVAKEIEDAIDRAAGVGQSAWKGRAWAYNLSPKHNFGSAIGKTKPKLETRVWSALGRIVDLIPEVFPLSTRKISTGVTIGYGVMPTLPYYGGVIIGLQFQNYMTRGVIKASWDAANMLPTMAGAIGSHAGYRPDMVGSVMARMWKDGQWRPESAPVITKDFQILTADHIAELAHQHGLKSSFIQAETADSLMKKIYEAYPTDVVGRLQQPFKWWQTFKIEAATFIDNYIRLRIFIDELKSGRRPNDAARIAKRTAYDYSELSDAEKVVARNVIMFYSYFRKNADLFWDTAITNPERIISQLRLISGSQRAAAEGEDEAIVFPAYAGTRALTPTVKSFYNTQRYKGINYMAPYLPVPDMLMIPAAMYDSMFLEGEYEARGTRDLVGRLNPLIQTMFVSATGMDLYFNRDLNRGNNQIPAYVILADHAWTGGMLWDYLDIEAVSVDKIKNPVYQEVQGRVIYVARNGKNFWRWKNLNQVAGGGRTANFLWDLDKMNLGYIEAQNSLNLAYLEYTGGGLLQQIGWLDQFRKPMAGSNQPGFSSVLRGKGPIEDWAEPGSPYYDTAWPRPGMSKVVGQRVPERYAHLIGLPPDDAIAELRASYPTDDVMMSSLDAIDVPGLTPREKSRRLMALYGTQTTVDPSALSLRELPAAFGFRPLFQQHQETTETQMLRRHLRRIEEAARAQQKKNE